MTFTAEAYIKDMHEMSFFVQQMNNIDISPSVHGRRIYITLKDEDGKNEFAFTLSSK